MGDPRRDVGRLALDDRQRQQPPGVFVERHSRELHRSASTRIRLFRGTGRGLKPPGRMGERVDGAYVGLAWRGTRQSAITMLPTGYASSFCWATENGKIVGSAGSYSAPSGAALWSSTNPDDFVILPTVGAYLYSSAIASDIRGEFIVGDATLATWPNPFHAAVWAGPKHVFYDLHNPSWEFSSISATNGLQHAGTVTPHRNSSATHAVVWMGTSRQFVDLHDFLPPGQFWGSEAWGILPDGTVIGTAYRASYWQPTAVLWIPGG